MSTCRIVGGTDAQNKPITGYQIGTDPVQWQRLETVMAPATPPYFYHQRHPYQWSNHGWMGSPNTKPFPGGVYEVRNASLDKQQKLGAWSQPAIVTVQSGAQLYCGGWNLPALQYEAGVVWKITCVSVEPECAGWGINPGDEYSLISPNHWNGGNISPSVACEPELHKLMVYKPLTYPLSRLVHGGDHQTVAPPPIVVPTSIPNKRFRLAYCFVAESGETALSPLMAWSDPVTVPNWTDAQAVEVQLRIANHFPQGTMGYHVYIQLENEEAPWKRLPASHCHGVPAVADDWLFQIWDRQPRLFQYRDDAPTHHAGTPAQSTLTGLHLVMKEVGFQPWAEEPLDVIVEVDTIDVSCPVHDEWGTNGTGTPFKFRRRVLGKDGRSWTIKQKPSGANRYWPVVHISNSYSQWHDCNIVGVGASAAVSFDDMAGGQCFGTELHNCKLMPGASQCGGLSYGLLVSERSTSGYGGHTHSEGRYYNCTFGGDVCVKLGGNQTANINFIDTHSSCTALQGAANKGRRNVVLWLVCPNEVRFRGLWGGDSFSGPVVFVSGYHAKLKADHLWKDQLSSAIFECQTGCNITAKVMSGKLNLWSRYEPQIQKGWPPTLARFHHTNGLAKINLADMQSQYSYWPTTADVTAPNCNLVETRFEDTILDSQVALVEPTYAEWSAEYKAMFGQWSTLPAQQPTPGMRITIPAQVVPAQTIPLPVPPDAGADAIAQSVTIPAQTLPEQTVVKNSLTGQQEVTRRPWK